MMKLVRQFIIYICKSLNKEIRLGFNFTIHLLNALSLGPENFSLSITNLNTNLTQPTLSKSPTDLVKTSHVRLV